MMTELVIYEMTDLNGENGMKVSAKAEYACVALTELAVRHQRGLPTSLKVIADVYGISQGFLMQIFMQLKGARFVRSVRGASGGYQLSRSPEKIRLSEIVDAVDGPSDGNSALSSSPDLPLIETLQDVWDEVHKAERQVLENITLYELIRRARVVGEPDFQI